MIKVLRQVELRKPEQVGWGGVRVKVMVRVDQLRGSSSSSCQHRACQSVHFWYRPEQVVDVEIRLTLFGVNVGILWLGGGGTVMSVVTRPDGGAGHQRPPCLLSQGRSGDDGPGRDDRPVHR